MIITPDKITLEIYPGTHHIKVTPSARRTYLVLPVNAGQVIGGEGNGLPLTFFIDTSESEVGDELIIFSSRDIDSSDQHFAFHEKNNIVFTRCGNAEENNDTFSPPLKWVGRFWFTGDVFINAYDNC